MRTPFFRAAGLNTKCAQPKVDSPQHILHDEALPLATSRNTRYENFLYNDLQRVLLMLLHVAYHSTPTSWPGLREINANDYCAT